MFTLLTLACLSAPVSKPVDEALAGQVPLNDLLLREPNGKIWKFSEHPERLLVILFVTVDCPLAKLYAARLAGYASTYKTRGVGFVVVAPSRHDRPADLARFARTHHLPFPIVRDIGAQTARKFGATRSPEVVVLDADRRVCYRGRIDDQYSVGRHRPAASSHELRDALDALLAGRPVAVPRTETSGCPIAWPKVPATSGKFTYCRDIAPIILRRCASCHRKGQAAPFVLTSYEDVVSWAAAVREVVEDRRMPPWGANPAHGKFANDPSLTSQEKQTLFAWIENGCPRGDVRDLPPPASYRDGWTISKPDLVVSMPKAFEVPADGLVDYQYIRVHAGFPEERWVKAAEILPGNPAVVHHCAVYLQPPGADSPHDLYAVGELESFNLTMYHPGTGPLVLPDGVAKRIPKGWRIVFVMHYQAVGTKQTDCTQLGLVFADPDTVHREAATKLIYEPNLRIPPRAGAHRVSRVWIVPRDIYLLAFTPHLHLRGRSFRYELQHSDGTFETLLDVPAFDVAWQHRYVLAEPRLVQAGSVIRCRAVYDNSPDNPLNPNPDIKVRTGIQTQDEMFNGFIDFMAVDELESAQTTTVRTNSLLVLFAVSGFGLCLIWFASRRLLTLRRSRANHTKIL